MKSSNPDSYCGIYCGACSVFMHGETGRPDGFVACLGGMPKVEIAYGGCNLAAEAYKMAGWRKLLCRFLLPMLYSKGKGKG